MSFDGNGVFAAVATPLDAANRIDTSLLSRHCAGLLRRGVDGVTLFGTTGEGPSFTVDERRATLEALLASGIAPERIIVFAGAAATGDAIALARHALAHGCTRVLLMPPFYFKDVGSRGIADSISAVVDALDDARLRVVLYHIPQVSGIAFDDAAISMLRERHGAIIAGIKDSTGNLAHSLALVKTHPGLQVYVGAETTIGRVRSAGGAGTICGLANVVPEQVRTAYDSRHDDEAGPLAQLLEAIAGKPFVPRLKAWLAATQREDGWRRVRAPLVADTDAVLPHVLKSAAAA